MPVNSNLTFGPTISDWGGHLKVARINEIDLLCDSATLGHSNNYQYNRYIATYPTGVRQKVLHSRGTKEVNFSCSGDLSIEGQAIVSFLRPAVRGLRFPVRIQQGPTLICEQVLTGMMEQFSLSGGPDGTVKYQISGKALDDVSEAEGWNVVSHKYAVPGWSSGNELVKSWSITHGVSLTPQWHNNQNPLPSYYRPQESEYSLKVSTVVSLREYDTLSIGVGSFALITGVVTHREIQYSGRETKIYSVEITNVNVSDDSLSTGAVATYASTPPTDWI